MARQRGGATADGDVLRRQPDAAARVRGLHQPQKAYTLTADILCSSPTDTFTTMLYPGSYEVRIYGRGNNASPLPTGQYLAASSLVIP